jgi:superfamily II DNA or RNA helicase
MDYKTFIESKRHTTGQFWFDPVRYPNEIFDFQKHIVDKAIRKGRMGIFADTGLWKTRISLSIAENIVRHTWGRVLILTPLAVAFQFIDEAKAIWIESIEYSKEWKHKEKIVICNYERLHYFDSKDFEGVILDESSILKNFKGEIKSQITQFMKKINYRYLTTATPSPNDFIELGTSSEALGYMWYTDMLWKFFRNNQWSVDAKDHTIGEKYYLKPHAEKSFFQWVNSWSIMVKKPSDLWFDDTRYKLPDLIIHTHEVKNNSEVFIDWQAMLFNEIRPQAKSMSEIRSEQKQTEYDRCIKAVELAKDKLSVYRCNTNNESKILKELDPEAVEIIGSQTIEQKEDILKRFANGEIKRLITKASMTWMWLNRQHCNHCVYFPTWSYEQYYQAIRRFWRFGQKNNVVVDLVISNWQHRVIQALTEKMEKAKKLYENLVENVNSVYTETKKEETNEIPLPSFIL